MKIELASMPNMALALRKDIIGYLLRIRSATLDFDVINFEYHKRL